MPVACEATVSPSGNRSWRFVPVSSECRLLDTTFQGTVARPVCMGNGAGADPFDLHSDHPTVPRDFSRNRRLRRRGEQSQRASAESTGRDCILTRSVGSDGPRRCHEMVRHCARMMIYESDPNYRNLAGRVSVKLDPLPSVLRARSSPPIPRARSRLIASPSPVPSARRAWLSST